MSSKNKPKGTHKQPTTEQLTEMLEGLRNRVQELEQPMNTCSVVERPQSPLEVKGIQINDCNNAIAEYTANLEATQKRFYEIKEALVLAKTRKLELLREFDKLSIGS